MNEILDRVEKWTGGKTQALAWYRSQTIPALGGRTAQTIVADGEAASVVAWLDHVALGGAA